MVYASFSTLYLICLIVVVVVELKLCCFLIEPREGRGYSHLEMNRYGDVRLYPVYHPLLRVNLKHGLCVIQYIVSDLFCRSSGGIETMFSHRPNVYGFSSLTQGGGGGGTRI